MNALLALPCPNFLSYPLHWAVWVFTVENQKSDNWSNLAGNEMYSSAVNASSPGLQCVTPAMIPSIAKVIQPTATVSSVPVSGPSKNQELL